MPLSQEVEQIFKLRADFKESQKSQGSDGETETHRDQDETAKIAELIKKIKE